MGVPELERIVTVSDFDEACTCFGKAPGQQASKSESAADLVGIVGFLRFEAQVKGLPSFGTGEQSMRVVDRSQSDSR